MNKPDYYIIKSFKHDGHVHRMWLENWRIPPEELADSQTGESMIVFVNNQTKIQEADGRTWQSKIPGVSFFIPGEWHNVVALIEETGIRYYCNIASPPYLAGNVLTYIDYDLDVICLPGGKPQIVDQDEFERHRIAYRYNRAVEIKVQTGMKRLLERIENKRSPFDEETIMGYFEKWKLAHKESSPS